MYKKMNKKYYQNKWILYFLKPFGTLMDTNSKGKRGTGRNVGLALCIGTMYTIIG